MKVADLHSLKPAEFFGKWFRIANYQTDNQQSAGLPLWLSRVWIQLSLVVSSLGAAIALFLTIDHSRADKILPCSIGSCDVVNASSYSEIFGIPIAFLGLLTYAFVFIQFTGIYYLKEKVVDDILPVIVLISFLGFLFSLYLTYIELFVLKAICIWCVVSATIISFIFLLSLGMLKNKRSLKSF